MFDILLQNHQLFLQGLGTTLKLLVFIMLIGIPGGILLGIIGGRYFKFINRIVEGLKFFTKVVPVLVLLFWLHYPFQALLQVVIDPFWTTVLALGFVNLIFVAHIIQNELKLLPKEYSESGLSLGMSKKQIIKHIEVPILLRRVLPNIALGQATMLEYTLFASLISVPELFRVAQTVNSMVYDPVAVYSLLVIFFLIILTPLHLFINYFKKKNTISYV